MKIKSQALTTCEVATDGEAISLGFVDTTGGQAAINLPLEQVTSLAMTLPMLIEKALRARYGDDSLRYTYPLGSWTFEQSSDLETTLVTLRTIDGFSVCFSMQRGQKDKLSKALAENEKPTSRYLAN